MGTRLNRLIEAFKRLPTNNVLSKQKKNIKHFHLKMNIFTAVKYCCILHGRVCVMSVKAVDESCALSGV